MKKSLSSIVLLSILALPASAFAELPNFVMRATPYTQNIKKTLIENNLTPTNFNNLRIKYKDTINEFKEKAPVLKQDLYKGNILEKKPVINKIKNNLEFEPKKLNTLDDKLPQTLEVLKKHTQKPKQIKRIIKNNLAIPPKMLGTKMILKLNNPKVNITGSISTKDLGVRVLKLKNFKPSDKISSRVGQSIEFKTENAHDIALIFEIPNSQDSFELLLNEKQYIINIKDLKDKNISLSHPDIKDIDLAYLTNKKILKESKDYEFENKNNKIAKRLQLVRQNSEKKQECKNLLLELKQTEYDGFEEKAENYFKLLEANPSITACKAARRAFQNTKEEIKELRYKNKKIMFRDAAEGWFKSHVERISQRMVRGVKLFQGYKDVRGKLTGNFGPLNEVKLGELLKVALISAGHQESVNVTAAVQQNHWASGFAQTAKDLNLSIALELSDLNRPVTRGQVLQTFAESLMLINPLNPTANSSSCDFDRMKNAFADFDSTHPQALATCIFVQDEIIKGSQGNLMLDGPTNRAEIAKILNNVLDKYVDSEETIEEAELEETMDELEEELDRLEDELDDTVEQMLNVTEDLIDNILDDNQEDEENNNSDDNTVESNDELEPNDPTIEADENEDQIETQEQEENSNAESQDQDLNQDEQNQQPAQDQ